MVVADGGGHVGELALLNETAVRTAVQLHLRNRVEILPIRAIDLPRDGGGKTERVFAIGEFDIDKLFIRNGLRRLMTDDDVDGLLAVSTDGQLFRAVDRQRVRSGQYERTGQRLVGMVTDGQFAIGDAARENDRFAVVFHGECAGSDADRQTEIRDFWRNVLQHELAFPLAFDFR